MRVLEEEQKSLMTVNLQLREDLESLGNKKIIVEEERGRLKQENNSLRDQVSTWCGGWVWSDDSFA